MRKGLVLTLGVALALSVAPSFAEAPIISCLPDIVISDFDKTQQTADTNLFVFQDALDLDEYVQDADTTDTQIRWSFIETSGADIQIMPDGGATWIGEITAGQQLEPGSSNIRGGNGFIDIRNTSMTGTTVGSRVSTLEVWVSDGVASRSETVLVTTVNTNGTTGSAEDALVPPVTKTWTFQTGAENWGWTGLPPYAVPAHQAANGSLEITQSVTTTTLTYGQYSSPKDPTNGLRARPGCIMRAKFLLRSTTTSAGGGANKHPGFRLMAHTAHMVFAGGIWQVNWMNQDFLDIHKVLWNSIDMFHIAGREPGATAKTYTMLHYPFQAAETLLATDTLTYLACELLDMQFEGDLGTLYIDEVTVDAVDRPELGSGTAVDEFSTTAFAAASWKQEKVNLGGMNDANLTYGVTNNALTVTATPGNQMFEIVFSLQDGGRRQPVVSGNWYRLNWRVSTTEQAGDYIVPTVRTALRSERFIWIAYNELNGGGLVARFGSTPTETELWCVAPSPLPPSTTLTEPMSPVFEGYGLASNTGWPFFKTVAGTVRAHSVRVERYAPLP